jgi:hypothetical protein
MKKVQKKEAARVRNSPVPMRRDEREDPEVIKRPMRLSTTAIHVLRLGLCSAVTSQGTAVCTTGVNST